ncbi:hypothetical protein K440DRAFT_620428 [Wilcoxina mikolae CBS 423.85]|nr:hypothetical protein K440DRAFT_620428 [Wilcoxina mikolae CBS 423.85]
MASEEHARRIERTFSGSVALGCYVLYSAGIPRLLHLIPFPPGGCSLRLLLALCTALDNVRSLSTLGEDTW